MEFLPYTPPNEGAGLLSTDRDLCWRINPRGLVTPAVIGAVCWARNNFQMSEAQHAAILTGLGLEYHRMPGGSTELRPNDAYRQIPFNGLNTQPPIQSVHTAFSLVTPVQPLIAYDAIEVYPCIETAQGIERFEANEHAPATSPTFWSVALHLEAGHIETIADFPARLPAEMFGEVMRGLVLMDRQAAGLDTRHLQSGPVSTGLFLCRERIPDPD